MTFVVRRPQRRWEIRESVSTDNGPRARTLATFHTLTDDVVERAATKARRPFDADQVRVAARRAGARLGEDSVDHLARTLLRELGAGHTPSPGLRQLLVDRLTSGDRAPRLEAGSSVAEWIGATPERRGEALRDLLELTDRLPAPKDAGLRFPGFAAASASGR